VKLPWVAALLCLTSQIGNALHVVTNGLMQTILRE